MKLIVQKVSVICILLFSLSLHHLQASSNKEVIALAIFTSEDQKNEWLQKLDQEQLRVNFHELFYGFTFKTTLKTVEEWKNSKVIIEVLASNEQLSIAPNFNRMGVEQMNRYLHSNHSSLTGEGIKVGVIDTGINYDHRDLRNNYSGGNDLVDEDDDPMETKEKNEFLTLHGTHVAGIIAANGQMVGVAPNAQIISYRALGPDGSGSTEQVMAAIEKAVEEQVDILNLSLGTNINAPDLPMSLALNKAVEKGIVVVIAAGNAGPNNWTVASPGTAKDAITVGAIHTNQEFTYLEVNRKEIEMIPFMYSIKWTAHAYSIANFGIGDNQVQEDLNNKIALIERGTIPFTEKAINAYQNHAVACIIYNNEDGLVEGSLEETLPIPVYSISREDGLWLKNELQKKEKIYAKPSFLSRTDQLANFSSRGPVTNQFLIKPDIVAPGVAIQSTVANSYASMQGTSMAAPYVSGASAIIKQAHPSWNVSQIKSALMNTAKVLKDTSNEELKVYAQGAGKIQLERALNTKTFLYPSSLSFGRVDSLNVTTHLTIENNSTNEQKYSIEPMEKQSEIEWSLPSSFYLQPGEKKEIELVAKIKSQSSKLCLLDGYLKVISTEQQLTIPYLLVVNEPDYPRIYGLNAQLDKVTNELQIDSYFPEEVDELLIVSFDEDHLLFDQVISWEKDVPRGMYNKIIKYEDFMNKNKKFKLIASSKGIVFEEEFTYDEK